MSVSCQIIDAGAAREASGFVPFPAPGDVIDRAPARFGTKIEDTLSERS
jgi:hypothetical protein